MQFNEHTKEYTLLGTTFRVNDSQVEVRQRDGSFVAASVLQVMKWLDDLRVDEKAGRRAGKMTYVITVSMFLSLVQEGMFQLITRGDYVEFTYKGLQFQFEASNRQQTDVVDLGKIFMELEDDFAHFCVWEKDEAGWFNRQQEFIPVPMNAVDTSM